MLATKHALTKGAFLLVSYPIIKGPQLKKSMYGPPWTPNLHLANEWFFFFFLRIAIPFSLSWHGSSVVGPMALK